MISFEVPPGVANVSKLVHGLAQGVMRKWARWADDHEHERVDEWVNTMWSITKGGMMGGITGGGKKKDKPEGEKKEGGEKKVRYQNVLTAAAVEELSWGDAGLYLAMPFMGLGGAAIQAVGSDEQKEKFLTRFTKADKPVWGAMAITEPNAGSDSANISTTAQLDEKTKEWILNGEKIFVTQGKSSLEDSEGLVVVWATRDKKIGRPAIKSFVVEHGTPGAKVSKVEEKMGIRASDTASIVFEDCRIPYENVLGDPEIKTSGFKGAMATFDATRPLVAASAIGIGRAALERAIEIYTENGGELRYGINPNKLQSAERDLMMMEAQLKASRLLTWKAAWMADAGLHNNLEASVCKAKTGKAVTWIANKAVEVTGPVGYGKTELLEKWLRDAKINDIFEGTGQINTLVVARRYLGLSSSELK